MKGMDLDAKGIGALLIRLLLAFVLLYSAIVKIHPIEPFLFTIMESGYVDWTGGAVLARLVIGTELALSVLLLFGIAPRRTIITSFFFLSLLSLHLILFMLREGVTEDCGCFGAAHQVSPLSSLFKNLLMLFLLSLLWRWRDKWTLPFIPHTLFILCFGIGLLLPFIIEPSEELFPHEQKTGNKELPLNAEGMEELVEEGLLEPKVLEGKWMIAFLSPGCRYCKWSARKWGILEERYGKELPARFFFIGDEEEIQEFWEKTARKEFPSKPMNHERLFRFSGNRVPAYYPVEDGRPLERWSLRELREERLREFFE